MRRFSVPLAALALASVAPAADRVMVGDDIYVGADENLNDVVCVFCSIQLDGSARDAVAVLGDVTVAGEVSGDAVAVLGKLEISGSVGGDAAAVLGRAKIDGEINGDLAAVLGQLELGPQSRIDGDVAAVLGDVKGLGDARIGGSIDIEDDIEPLARGFVLFVMAAVFFGCLLAFTASAFIASLLCGEQRTEVLRATVANRPGMSLLTGIGMFWMCAIAVMIISWAFPPAAFVPLILAAVGYAGISLAIGRVVSSSIRYDAGVALGAVLITVLQFIPVIGWLFGGILFFMALGAPALSGFGESVDWLMARKTPGGTPANAR